MATSAVTPEEVLAAVEKRSVQGFYGEDIQQVWSCTKSDVLEFVATERGWIRDSSATSFGSKYVSPQAQQGKFVTIGSIERTLDTLVKEGKIAMVSGRHWAMSGVYNTRSTTSYYLSRQAQEIASVKADAQENAKITHNAEKYALSELAARHGVEFEEIKNERIAAVAIPNHASLWFEPEEQKA